MALSILGVAMGGILCTPVVADEPIELEAPNQVAGDRLSALESRLGSRPAESIQLSRDQTLQSVQWLASLALEKVPRIYEGDKDWGEQKKIWAGVRAKLDGWKLKTHRRWNHVNHGRWLQYQVSIPDAVAGNAAQVTIQDVRKASDPNGNERWVIDSAIVTPLTFTARIQRWNLGVKLYSMTIRGRMQVRLQSTTSLGFLADYSEVPPALEIDPQIESALLVMEHFEVDRISSIGGDFAEETGELLEDTIGKRFLAKQNDKLVAKLNKSIDKQRDDLRLSMARWISELSE